MRKRTKAGMCLAPAVVALGLVVSLHDSGGTSGAVKAQASREPRASQEPSAEADAPAPRLVLPVERYLLTEAEEKVLDTARNKLAEKCMRRSGYSGFTMPEQSPNPVRLTTKRYGLTDMGEARTFGYEPADGAQANNPVAEFYNSLSSQVKTSLMGQSGEPIQNGSDAQDLGCMGHALEVINGSRPPYDKIEAAAMEVQTESWNRSFKDARLAEYFDKWSACMRKSGYEFKTPMDAPGDQVLSKEREVAMAVAEVECNRTSGLVEQWFAIDSEYQKALVDDHIVALRKGREVMDSRLRNAREELAGT